MQFFCTLIKRQKSSLDYFFFLCCQVASSFGGNNKPAEQHTSPGSTKSAQAKLKSKQGTEQNGKCNCRKWHTYEKSTAKAANKNSLDFLCDKSTGSGVEVLICEVSDKTNWQFLI